MRTMGKYLTIAAVVAKIPTTPTQLLRKFLLEPYDNRIYAALCAQSPIHKVTQNFSAEWIRPDSFLARICLSKSQFL